MTPAYSAVVARLIRYGSTAATTEWPDYVKELGLSSQHVGELLRVARDPHLLQSDVGTAEAWAPVHAWRALSQLGAIEVLELMVDLVEADVSDGALFEFPAVAARLGAAAIPPLQTVMDDPNRTDVGRIAIVGCLRAIAGQHPAARNACVTVMSNRLRRYRENGIELNAVLVRALCDLAARDAFPVIEEAFLAQQVDLSEVTWDQVLAALAPRG